MNKIASKIIKSLNVRSLYQPKADSHKGENGKVLIIGGNERFHGSPIFAAKIASRIVDLVYFCSTPGNNDLVREMKKELSDFITVERDEVINWVSKVDSVLVGPGMDVTEETRILVNTLLKQFPKQKFILDADALRVLDKKFDITNLLIITKEQFKNVLDQEIKRNSFKNHKIKRLLNENN